MQSRVVNIDEFNWDHMMAPPLYSLITQDACNEIHRIATSVRYSGNARKRYEMIDNVLKPFGFEKKGAGTNRVVYKYMDNDTFLLKVATDAVGVGDNPREFKNQFTFKPFVTKIFEVDPTGAVALIERVVPITSREEFLTCADDIYDVIRGWFVGDYILADIGTKFFMNWGIRKGFGPVLLDFPYIYELDGNKLFCNENINGCMCGGEIDYDDGYNFLWCQKCGKRYRVQQLAKAETEKQIIVKGRESKMKIVMKYGNDTVKTSNNSPELMREETECIKKPVSKPLPKNELKIECGFVPKEKKNKKPINNDNGGNKPPFDKKEKTDHSSNGINNRGIVRNNMNTNVSSANVSSSNTKEIEDLRKQIADWETKYNSLKSDYKEKEEELEGAYKDYDTMESMRDEERRKVEELEEKLKAAESSDNSELEKKISDLEFEKNSLASKVEELEAREIPEDKTEEIKELNEDLKEKSDLISKRDSEIDSLNNTIKDLQGQIEQFKTTITNYTVNLKEIKDIAESEKQQIIDEKNRIIVERDNLKSDNDDLRDQIDVKCERISELKKIILDAENKGVKLPIDSEELLRDEGREEYADAVRSADGVNMLTAELTTINALNLSNGKELLDEDQYVVAIVTEDGEYLTDQDGDVLCIYIIDNVQIPEILKNEKKLYETSNKVKLIKLNS